MHFNMSKESSQKVLSGVKWLTNAGQNYFTSPTSSRKKIINAILLVPIIVPTAVTALSIGFTWLFLNAVDAQKNDSTLSKIAKSVAKVLISVIAAAVLISCIILNLVISLLPFLILLAINKDIFKEKSVNIESKQDPTRNKVDINNKEGYDQRIGEEIDNLITDQEQSSEEQHGSTHNHALVNNGQLYNQPDVEIISRNLEGEQAVDKTVVVKRINSAGVRDGKAMVRTVRDEDSITMKGVVTGDTPYQQKGFASGFSLQFNRVPGGMDLNFSTSTRTGDNQQAAMQTLLENEEARTMLSGNSGLLSIEEHSSRQHSGVN